MKTIKQFYLLPLFAVVLFVIVLSGMMSVKPAVAYDCGDVIAPNNVSLSTIEGYYEQWKGQYVTSQGAGGNLRVVRPENQSDTVSEGIAYGMLLAAYLDDQATFDGLWAYAQSHFDGDGVMKWQIDANNNAQGNDGATDAEEDMAIALIVADRTWGGYTQGATDMVNAIMDNEVEAGTWVLKNGNAWGGSNSTNPSYWAPGYYDVYRDYTGNNDWDNVTDKVYSMMNTVNNITGDTGLLPDWMTANGTQAGGQGYNYLYDASRVPWRVATHYAWSCDVRAEAQLDMLNNFFCGIGASNIVDGYDIYGNPVGQWNNATFVGMAATGTIASSNTSCQDQMWQQTVNLGWDGYFSDALRMISLLFMSGNMPNPMTIGTAASATNTPVSQQATDTPVPSTGSGNNLIGTAWWGAPVDPTSNNGALCFTTTGTSTNAWDELFGHSDLLLENGKEYVVSFTAYTVGQSATNILAVVGDQNPPYANYEIFGFSPSSTSVAYSTEFTMSDPTNAESNLTFQLGGGDAWTVCVEDVVLVEKGNAPTATPTNTPLPLPTNDPNEPTNTPVPSTGQGITAVSAAAGMGKGFNLGNMFDYAQNTATLANAQPKIDAYYAQGFHHVRIPVTWTEPLYGYTLADPDTGSIDASTARLGELTAILDYALSLDGMYVILNAHHEHELKANNRYDVLEQLWEEITALYGDRDYRLIFEILNEPHIDGDPMPVENIRYMSGLAYDKIRAADPERIVVIGGNQWFGKDEMAQVWYNLDPVGGGNDPYMMGTWHHYDPWSFSGSQQGDYSDVWNDANVYEPMDLMLEWANTVGNGMPLYIGEWGVGWGSYYDHMQCNNIRYWYEKMANEYAPARGIPTTVWDDGGWFMVWDHATDSWGNNLVDCMDGECAWQGTDQYGINCDDSDPTLALQGGGVTLTPPAPVTTSTNTPVPQSTDTPIPQATSTPTSGVPLAVGLDGTMSANGVPLLLVLVVASVTLTGVWVFGRKS